MVITAVASSSGTVDDKKSDGVYNKLALVMLISAVARPAVMLAVT
jgi:hypothetical protein